MSSFNRARGAAALLMALGLGGCFQPLYSEAAHPGLVAELREVEVAPIKDRIGHYLGDDLISRLNGTGETPQAKYRLVVTMSVSSQTPTIESQINAADAATVIGKAHFKLTKIDGGAVIYENDATSAAVYDRSLDGFANLRASRDAEIRISRALADEIETRVAAALTVKS
ncbi:MAG TPA: LPS assembly lipoprotein LptE [Roseiarcus sp.]|jgi:LPS-assembly lipoprotein